MTPWGRKVQGSFHAWVKEGQAGDRIQSSSFHMFGFIYTLDIHMEMSSRELDITSLDFSVESWQEVYEGGKKP